MKTRRSRYNNRGAAVVLIGLAVISVVAVAVFVANSGDRVKPVYYSELPRARAGLMDENGGTHSLEADFTLELNGRFLNNAEKNEVSGSIAAAMSAMDYGTLSGTEGVTYLKTELMELLNERYGEGVVNEIYLTGYAGDFNLPVKAVTPEDSHRDAVESLMDRLRR